MSKKPTYEALVQRIHELENEQKCLQRTIKKLKVREERLDIAMSVKNEGVWDWNLETDEVQFDNRYYTLAGYKPDEFPHALEEFQNRVHQDDLDLVMERAFKYIFGKSDRFLAEFRFRKKDGKWIWIQATGKIVKRDKIGKPIRFVGTHADITERKRTEEDLRRSEAVLAETQRIAGLGSWEYHLETKKIKWSDETYRIAGRENRDIENLDQYLKIVHPDDKTLLSKAIEKSISEKVPYEIELRHLKPDGTYNHTLTRGKPIVEGNDVIKFVGSVLDITHRKRAEEALQRATKLKSIGTLAGGIAHDFNNLLTGIFGNVELARILTKDEKVCQYLEKTLNTIERAQSLTGQLLTFAKGGAPITKIQNLVPFLQETAAFALSGSIVSCRFDIEENLWHCNVDIHQISQALDNIIINAQQSMPTGGTIDISAKNVELNQGDLAEILPGKYVELAIQDYGIGIPEVYLSRIFDPFFSTKTKGHGIGLSTTYSIITRHGGTINVESKPGKGTTFYVYLPASDKAFVESKNIYDNEHCGSGTFVIMDDEAVVRENLGDMLELFGYSVIRLENGADAVKLFSEFSLGNQQIVGMIFDLTVPGGMGGKEAIEQIRLQCKRTPVFVASGYTEDPVMASPEDYGFTASIKKPYKIKELIAILNKHMK